MVDVSTIFTMTKEQAKEFACCVTAELPVPDRTTRILTKEFGFAADEYLMFIELSRLPQNRVVIKWRLRSKKDGSRSVGHVGSKTMEMRSYQMMPAIVELAKLNPFALLMLAVN